jgi:hypothetical protein
MQAMGLQLLVDKPGQSATGEVRDDAKENSPARHDGDALQDALDAGGVQAMARLPASPSRRPAISS